MVRKKLLIKSVLGFAVGIASFSLGACGSRSGKDVADSSTVSKTTSTGRGDITFVGHIESNRRERLNLAPSAKAGQVYCEITPKGWAIVSMGTFYTDADRMNPSSPITGLTVTIPTIKDGQQKSVSQAFLNFERTSISSPFCTYFPPPAGTEGISGSVQCSDRSDRPGWGRMTVTANFHCG